MASTERSQLSVRGLTVEVVRKEVKNLHLGVYPPSGRVRVAAPASVTDDAIRLAVISKLSWIRRQRDRFLTQPRQSQREMVNGESHYFLGQRYRMTVVEEEARPRVTTAGKSRLELHAPSGSSQEQRGAVLDRWYRRQLRQVVGRYLTVWEDRLGVKTSAVGIKRMKTKWGSCNPTTHRIWLNSELAKKPLSSIEYIVVHELVHLLEPSHGERFTAVMDQHLPDWRIRQAELNSAPLAHEEWTY
jgi:predicted metal-dependent hydrolase